MDKYTFKCFEKMFNKWYNLWNDDKTFNDDDPMWLFEKYEVDPKMYCVEDEYKLSFKLYDLRYALKNYFDQRWFGFDNEDEEVNLFDEINELFFNLNELFDEIEVEFK